MTSQNRFLYRGAALGMVAAAVTMLTSCTHNGNATPHAAPTPHSPTVAASTATPSSPGRATKSSSTKTINTTTTTACRSLVVPDAVKATVTTAYGRQAQPPLTHIAPVKGTFYYGSCGDVRYAAVRFQLTPGSTEAEQVALQDEGGSMKYLVDRAGAGWQYVASGGFPASPMGCAAIPAIPGRLAALWNDCRSTVGQG